MNKLIFDYVKDIFYQEAGIQLDADQDYLVESRLSSLAFKEQMADAEAIFAKASGGDLSMRKKIVEAMLTTETFFFRDIHPFETLESKILPEFIEKNRDKKTLKIWSGACSTGQEPYSIAMIALEKFSELRNWDFKIIATDLSDQNLDKCRSGTYSTLQVKRGLPESYLNKYFTPQGQDWRITQELTNMISFEKLNLLEHWSYLDFDIVFMRNVLIYFERDIKCEILNRIAKSMVSGGYLLLGSGETTLGLCDSFVPNYGDNTVSFKLMNSNL